MISSVSLHNSYNNIASIVKKIEGLINDVNIHKARVLSHINHQKYYANVTGIGKNIDFLI